VEVGLGRGSPRSKVRTGVAPWRDRRVTRGRRAAAEDAAERSWSAIRGGRTGPRGQKCRVSC